MKKRKRRLEIALWTGLCVLLLCACGKKDKLVIETAPLSADETETELAGAWYGWWKIYNTSGSWYGKDGYWWDCCGALSEEGGKKQLLLWDEDLPKEEGMGLVTFDDTPGRIIYAQGNNNPGFVGRENCSMIFTEDDDGLLLTIEGSYESVRKGGFDYCVYLRPWGSRWSGSEIPYYYNSWYLPLIESGAVMPDSIG